MIQISKPRSIGATPAVPIPNASGLSVMGVDRDGFSSPSEAAYTPPGVVTKLDTIQRRVEGISPRKFENQHENKMSCLSCGKTTPCMCKKCALAKLQLYAKRQKISVAAEKKDVLEATVQKFMCEQMRQKKELFETRSRLITLRKQVEEKKKSAALLGAADSRFSTALTKSVGNIKKLNEYIKKHGEQEVKSIHNEKEKKDLLTATVQKMCNKRRLLCAFFFKYIYPLKELNFLASQTESDRVRRELLDARSNGEESTNDDASEESSGFQIREAEASCRMWKELGPELTGGVLSLTSESQGAFGAFVYSMHLVNLLSTVLDIPLPFHLSVREVSLNERWTEPLYATDFFKLRMCIVHICLQEGVNPKKLNFLLPHQNLRLLYEVLGSSEYKGPTALSSEQQIEITRERRNLKWQERDYLNEWEIVDAR